MAKITYVSEINGKKLFAERAEYTRSGTNIDNKFSEIDQKIVSMGSFEVVPLTSGANPVPDVSDPKTTIIYLTKDDGSSAKDPYTEWIYIPASTEPAVSAHWEIIGETSIDLSGYKTKQTAVSVTGGTLKGVASMTQNANGEVTLTLNDIQDGTTSQKGVVKLENSHTSTSTTTAATPNAVKEAYDLANSKYTLPSGGITESDLSASVNASLDAADTALQPVSGATSGNFVGFGSNGAIVDSGKKAADFATAAQGTKADSAIQGVKVNGTALTPDASKVVDIPAASASAYGVVTYSVIELDEPTA
jgi:hypothetical protein